MRDRLEPAGGCACRSRARRRRGARVAAAASAAARVRTACGEVKLNENAWAARPPTCTSLKYVLEKKLGCKVKVTNVTENQPSFQAMADGKIDVVLEDWDNLAGIRRTRRTIGRERRPARRHRP